MRICMCEIYNKRLIQCGQHLREFHSSFIFQGIIIRCIKKYKKEIHESLIFSYSVSSFENT